MPSHPAPPSLARKAVGLLGGQEGFARLPHTGISALTLGAMSELGFRSALQSSLGYHGTGRFSRLPRASVYFSLLL